MIKTAFFAALALVGSNFAAEANCMKIPVGPNGFGGTHYIVRCQQQAPMQMHRPQMGGSGMMQQRPQGYGGMPQVTFRPVQIGRGYNMCPTCVPSGSRRGVPW